MSPARYALLSLSLVACGGDPTPADAGRDAGVPPDAYVEPPLAPDLFCPGSEGCEEGGDPQLQAGVASLEITPTIRETFTDLNDNGTWDPPEEPFEDANGDGVFQGEWIAGFGHGRAADGVLDPLWARALALRSGNTTVVFVMLDTIGYFVDEMNEIRGEVAARGLDVDHVAIGATHTHQGRDTIGIWGPTLSDTGLDRAHMAFVRAQVVEAVAAALADLRPAAVQYASFFLRDVDPEGDVNRYVGDNRHPNIVDDEVRVMRFFELGTDTAAMPGTGTTIATMVGFGAHPEYLWSRNRQLSSDWPHWLRTALEEGIASGPDGAPIEGLGGTSVFVQGAIGSQIGPNRIHPRRWDGTEVEGRSPEGAETVGTQLAAFVLAALRGDGAVTELTADLGLRTASFYVLVENRRYHIAGLQGLFDRELFLYDAERAIRVPTNVPSVRTAITLLDVGRATMLTLPGELDPAEFVGGYEAPCPYTPGGCDALLFGGENLPDLSQAPAGPFLRERLLARRPDALQAWPLGLTDDYLGYYIPEFDFELSPGLPYIGEAPGQHYEETNSVGEAAWPRIRAKMIELLAWTP